MLRTPLGDSRIRNRVHIRRAVSNRGRKGCTACAGIRKEVRTSAGVDALKVCLLLVCSPQCSAESRKDWGKLLRLVKPVSSSKTWNKDISLVDFFLGQELN